MNIKDLTKTLDFAQAAKAFLDARGREREVRDEYRQQRNLWMRQEYGVDAKYGAGRRKWSDVVNEPGFQEATSKLYDTYQEAKRERLKAQGRMLTRYLKLPHEIRRSEGRGAAKATHLKLVGKDK